MKPSLLGLVAVVFTNAIAVGVTMFILQKRYDNLARRDEQLYKEQVNKLFDSMKRNTTGNEMRAAYLMMDNAIDLIYFADRYPLSTNERAAIDRRVSKLCNAITSSANTVMEDGKAVGLRVGFKPDKVDKVTRYLEENDLDVDGKLRKLLEQTKE